MKSNRKYQTSSEEGLVILAQASGPILFELIKNLSNINPVWNILFLSTMGMLNAWGNFGQIRTAELVQYIDDNKEMFVIEAIESNRFKTIFLNIIERHIKEGSEEKRRRLRALLLSAGSEGGQLLDSELDTKTMVILDQITTLEFQVFSLWGGGMQEAIASANKISPDISEFDERYMKLNIHQVRNGVESAGIEITDNELNFVLRSLGGYGLLSVREMTSPLVGGGIYDVYVDGITPFGQVFLERIVV